MHHLLVRLNLTILLIATPLASSPALSQEDQPVLGYINEFLPETPEQAAARHAKVQQRRARINIMMHRGATRFAPENSLEAFNEAIDRGADGVELDIRRSADGVLYLFHDSTLDDLQGGDGRKGKNTTYYKIVSMKFDNDKGHSQSRVPTLVAFLQLAKERGMLLHLDVKESGIEEDLAKIFEEQDMWDHLAEVNGGNAMSIRNHKKVTLKPYKGWDKRKKDEATRREFQNSPGNMIFTKSDPHGPLEMLGRQKPEKRPLPKHLRALWYPDGTWKKVDQ